MPRDASGKETGWISKHALQEGALAADDKGRQATADGYIVPRMLHRNLRAKLSLLAQLEKRLKVLEEAEKEPAPAPPAEAIMEPVAAAEEEEPTEETG